MLGHAPHPTDPSGRLVGHLLGRSRWTAHTVAAHLGFTDAANFGRSFHHHTDRTPAAYRASQATPDS